MLRMTCGKLSTGLTVRLSIVNNVMTSGLENAKAGDKVKPDEERLDGKYHHAGPDHGCIEIRVSMGKR